MKEMLFQIVWIFPVYAFFGWCLEVVYCSVNTGEFVNRGFLNGAACPIYGIGAATLVLALEPFQDNLFILYFASVILGSLCELIGGFLLKKFFHMSWWDYSDQPLNIGGYICVKFSLAWGIAGVMVIRVIHPLIVNVVEIIPTAPFGVLLIVFYIFFTIDVVLTVLAILKLNRDLKEIDHLSDLIRKSSNRVAENIGNSAIQTADKMKELELAKKIKGKTMSLQLTAEKNRTKTHEKLDELLNNDSFIRLRLLKAFPNMKNFNNSNALSEIRLHIKNSVKKGH